MFRSLHHRLWLVITATLILPWLAAGELSAQAPDPDAAKKEGKIIVYGTTIPNIMVPIHTNFEKRYGVKVEYWRASATAVTDRATTEWRAGKPGFDVVFAINGTVSLLKKENALAKFAAPAAVKFPAQFKDKDDMLTAFRHTPISTLYNTELVKAADLPRSYDDLLDTKWQNKIVMPDPSRHTSTAQFLWNMQKIKGDKWLDYARALARQKPFLTESFAPVPMALAKGEGHIGITYAQYVTQVKGPLSHVVFDKVFTDSTDLAVGAKSSSPNAARLYIDYLCSPEAQKIIAETGDFPLAPGIYPNVKDAEKVVANAIFMDNPSDEQFKKLKEDFRRIFLGQ
ncbi:MAG: extracellular solute-binding protein [Deltaproteobacteria bacterium]|nr:extracellular solute-binding protein [Deltaproteobacteria bacterium]MDZ4342525.1 extracellular solute-binding protein [Candidatus Binatia bacterium]